LAVVGSVEVATRPTAAPAALEDILAAVAAREIKTASDQVAVAVAVHMT
jgi:hypothetical protein